jgi:toxin YhaV
LFFKFTTAQKSIVHGWLNDQSTLRKDGDRNDVYAVLARMLNSGTVPGSLGQLLQSSSSP